MVLQVTLDLVGIPDLLAPLVMDFPHMNNLDPKVVSLALLGLLLDPPAHCAPTKLHPLASR